MDFDPARILRASKLRFGDLRAQGVPAILFGVAAVVVAAGMVRVLRAAAPALPETLREAKGLIEATRPQPRPLQGS